MEEEPIITDVVATNVPAVTTQTTFVGKSKTFAGLEKIEWAFLIISAFNIAACAALTIYRLVKVVEHDPASPDFTFTIVILVNSVFCAFYITYGLLREKEFEIYAYCGAVFILFVYCLVEYIVNEVGRTNVKLARLIILAVLGTVNIILGVLVARTFGWLEFKIVGASEEFQIMYREASRFTSLLKFDLQLSVTFVIFVLQHGTKATEFDIYAIAIGLPILFLTTLIGWISLRMESKIGVFIFTILSLIQPSFVIYEIVKVYENKHFSSKYYDFYLGIGMLITGALALLNDIVLYYELFRVTRNFGKGLKERAYSVDEKTSLLAVSRRR